MQITNVHCEKHESWSWYFLLLQKLKLTYGLQNQVETLTPSFFGIVLHIFEAQGIVISNAWTLVPEAKWTLKVFLFETINSYADVFVTIWWWPVAANSSSVGYSQCILSKPAYYQC